LSTERIEFDSGGINLVGDLHLPDEPQRLGAIVLHPHPLYGGERRNNVSVGLAEGLARANFPALRFDFRGAGESGGAHGGGEPEVDDVAAAMATLREHVPEIQKVAIASYSFGTYVAALGAKALKPDALACVAPPVGMLDCDGLIDYVGPMLVVAGDRDQFGPAQPVAELAELAGAELQVIPGGDHFLVGLEQRVADSVVDFLDRLTGR